jgi:chitodextrinase
LAAIGPRLTLAAAVVLVAAQTVWFAPIGLASNAVPPPLATPSHADPSRASSNTDDAKTARITSGQLEAMAAATRDRGRRDADIARQLHSVGQRRKSALLRLVRSDPQAVVDALLPQPALDALTPQGGDVLERRVTVTGRYGVFHRDDAQGHETFTPQVLTPAGNLSIYTNGRMPDVRIGSTVSVTGYQLDQTIVAYEPGSTGTAPVTTTSAAAPTTPLGRLGVAVVLANFSNSGSTLDPSVPKSAFQGSPGADVDSWYAENSYGRSWLEPAVFGPFTIADTTSSGRCPDLTTAGNDLLNAASPYLTYSQFRRIVFVFNCSGYGASTSVGETQITTPQGIITGALTYADANALGDRATFAHELSHNLGNYHAALYVCQPRAFVPPTRFGQNCDSAEYGDEFDTLGATLTSPHATPDLDPYHKSNAGWFSPGNFPTVSAPGTYTYKLLPYETPTSGVLALDIPRGTSGTNFTLEYRQPTGFDTWMTGSNTTYCNGKCTATEGPTIRLVYPQSGSGGGSDTQAIDTTPSSIQSNTYFPIADNRDGALLAGETFTDPEYGISITTQNADATGATVQITIPAAATCTRTAPTVTLVSPSTETAAPGQTRSYTVSVTNNDSSPCPAEEYKYSGGRLVGDNTAGVTDSFTSVAFPDVFNLSPGASANVTVSLTPDATVVDGSYSFRLTSSGGIGTLSANALSVSPVQLPDVTFQVSSPADTAPPSAPINLAGRVLGSGAIALDWSPAADNVAVAGYRVLVDGVYVYYTASTNFTVYNLTEGSAHTFSVRAFDRQDNESSSATTSASTTARTDSTSPTPPGDVTATATDRTISINWSPSSDNVAISGYLLYPFNLWLPAGTSSVTLSNLATNSAYQIEIEALDGSGNRAESSITVTTAYAGTAAPTRPTNLFSPAATSNGGIELAWNASTDPSGVSGYYVYRNGRRWASVSGPTYTDPTTDLYPRAGYQFSVEAFDAAGNVSPRTAFVQTIAPAGGSADSNPPAGAALTAPLAGATLSGTVPLITSPVDDVGVSSVDFYVDGAYATTSYAGPFLYDWITSGVSDGSHTVYARAYDAAGNYSTAAITNVTVRNATLDTTAPSAPSNLTAAASSSNQVNLSWAASIDDLGVTGYDVYRNGTKIAAVTSAGWSDNSVTSSVTYAYYVVAYDAAGNLSATSSTVSVTTPSASPPTNTGAITGTVVSKSSSLPLGNVKVSYAVSGAKKSTTTNSSGVYLIGSLPPGSYALTFSLKSHKAVSTKVPVTGGQVITVNVAI